MSVLLKEIRRINARAASELESADFCTDSDIQSLTREDLSELFPGAKNFKLRRTIFSTIHKQKPINVLLEDLEGFIPQDSIRAALSSDGILVNYLLILKDMKTQVDNLQSFFEAHIGLLEKIRNAEPRQEPHRAFSGSNEGWIQPQQSSEKKHETRWTFSQPFTDYLFGKSATAGPVNPQDSQTETHPPKAKEDTPKVTKEPVITPALSSGDHTHGRPQKTQATVKYKMVVTGKTFNSHHQLLTQIKDLAPDLNLVEAEESSEDFQIVIVFCPIVSRAGTDVEAAMKTVTGDKPVILVLMNHAHEARPTTSARNWADFSKIVYHVNIFYHETANGLVRCWQNSDAVSNIKQELLKHSNQDTKDVTEHSPFTYGEYQQFSPTTASTASSGGYNSTNARAWVNTKTSLQSPTQNTVKDTGIHPSSIPANSCGSRGSAKAYPGLHWAKGRGPP